MTTLRDSRVCDSQRQTAPFRQDYLAVRLFLKPIGNWNTKHAVGGRDVQM